MSCIGEGFRELKVLESHQLQLLARMDSWLQSLDARLERSAQVRWVRRGVQKENREGGWGSPETRCADLRKRLASPRKTSQTLKSEDARQFRNSSRARA